ncbi:MAG: bifunctional tetrahydrofolate synthase/dihydrofolate synthase, partial [Enterobacterales bacterium]|nr:bifunctional tetrahydrofolate synthase/dihydrofolate synthase [Enterobacterales bacterium]
MPKSLDAWLDFIQAQHPADIELGLDRSRKVFNRLIELPLKSQTITVAGTNGKGTTVAMLESLASVNNLSVVSFTSPHLFDYRERIK